MKDLSYRYLTVFTVIVAVCIILDVYTWYGLRKTVGKKWWNFFKWFIPLSTVVFFVGFIYGMYRGGQGIHNASYALNIVNGFTFGVFLAKLLIATPFIIEDLVRVPLFFYRYFTKSKNEEKKPLMPGRRKFVRNISLALAAIPLSGTIYAITRGKYNYQVVRQTLFFDDLPEAFDGFKIVQFSDFHAGSFDDFDAAKGGLSLINEQHPDLVLFTGDLVNNRAAEVKPFQESFLNINAKYGKFAVLGNHDYGTYMPFNEEGESEENMKRLEGFYKDTNFRLLRNESLLIEKENAKIRLAGVENWGNSPFPQLGDLDQTFKDAKDEFNVLMSHDPDHWDEKILDFKKTIHLTLSGHTHGAQFGVDIPSWKWSPVKYRYKRWLGVYKHQNQHLYVSKGFGFLGFPGRIGMSPEIVVFELKKGIA